MAQWSGQFGSRPAFDYIVDINEVGRTESNATLRVQLRLKLHGSNSQTLFGYPMDWHCSCSGVNSGWRQVKTSARWYGGQDYRSYTYDLTIGADNNGKTVAVNVQTRTPGYSLSTGVMNQNFNFTISTRNTAPWWTADDMHINCWGQDIKYNAIIPENTGSLTVWCPTANDSEQGTNLHFDIHRYVNNNYSAQIKWGGSNRDGADNIAQWGAGTVFKYEGRVHDGQGGWAGSRWSWVYTKNTFSPATVGNVTNILTNQNALNFKVYSARNQGGICNNNYHYRITSLTPGVNVYGNREHHEDRQTDMNFTLGIKNNGGAVPTNPHWLDANEIKNHLASNGYNGTIRLRIESWNDYGSSGNADFNVNVDLRKDIGYTTIRHTSGWINFKNNNYYLPGYIPIKINWDAISDPLGGSITYEVLYQIGDGAWIFLANTGTSTSYTANLSTAIGNIEANNFRFIVRAKTSYGKQSDSGGPRVKLNNYLPATIRLSKIERSKSGAKINGSIQINTSIPGVAPNRCDYNTGGSNSSFLSSINQNGSNPFNFTFNIGNLDMSRSYTLNVTVSDAIGDALRAANIQIGSGNANATIPVFIPTVSLRKHGIGINSIATNDSALSVGGRIRVNGHVIDRVEEGVYRFGQEMTEDEEFKYGLNGTRVYNNSATTNNVEISIINDNWAPNSTKKVLKIKNTGPAEPGLGGFTWNHGTYKAAVFTYILTAKIPTGHNLNFAANSYGNGSKFEWITPNQGTGKYETYIGRAYCGVEGSFSTIGFFWLDGQPNCEWFVARATYFDNTQAPYRFRLKSLKIDDGGNGQVSEIISYKNTLLLSGTNESMLSANVFFDGANYIHFDKNRGASQIIMSNNSYPKYRWSNQGNAQYGTCQFSATYDLLTSYYGQQVMMQRGAGQDANRDFNYIVDTGIYATYMDGMANKPGGDAMYPYGLLLVFNSAGVVGQIWMPHNGGHCMHYRVRWDSGVWTNWANVGWSA